MNEEEEPRGCFNKCPLRVCVGIVGILVLIYGVSGVIAYGLDFDGLYDRGEQAERTGVKLASLWILIPGFIGSVGLVIASAFLIAAAFLVYRDEDAKDINFVFCFMVYDAAWATIVCVVGLVGSIINIVAIAHAQKEYERKYGDDDPDMEHAFTLMHWLSITWLVGTLITFIVIMGCLLPVYKYYDYIRPMAVTPSEGSLRSCLGSPRSRPQSPGSRPQSPGSRPASPRSRYPIFRPGSPRFRPDAPRPDSAV